jgi:uncharacterized heparinase superfamily protein
MRDSVQRASLGWQRRRRARLAGRWASFRARTRAWADRGAARRAALSAALARPAAIVWPEPRLAGDPRQGQRLIEGRLRIGTVVFEAPGAVPWDLAPDDPEAAALHGWSWLDDLAAVGDARARALAQSWVSDWVARYGRGAGPGWTPALSAGRLLRLLGHGAFLRKGQAAPAEAVLVRAVARDAAFLGRRWRTLSAADARLAALAALIEAGIALPGRRGLAAGAGRFLAREAGRAIDGQGATASRSPEALLACVEHLLAASRAMAAAGLPPPPELAAAVARAAPVLRALRHADAGLARFHGGDRGAEGRLDQVLAEVGRPSVGAAKPPLAMGFLRLAAGRTTLIADAAAPPSGAASATAHASTLAIEVTSGRRPLIVSCGPGRGFGPEWQRAARATRSHSALELEGLSSSRLGARRAGEEGPRLVDAPRRVIAEITPLSRTLRAELAHDGWRASHGLTCARILRLSPDGSRIEGEDLLTTLTRADAERLDRALAGATGLGLSAAVRFHLHPDVEAEADGRSAVLGLPSGEQWLLTQEGAAEVTLEPSVHLESDALRPRPALQAVLQLRVLGPTTRLRWTLAKSEGTSRGLRDLGQAGSWDETTEDAPA